MEKAQILAISDLHVAFRENFVALQAIGEHPRDYLILAGDVCESAEDLKKTIESLKPKFKDLFWVPGNHELWTMSAGEPRGLEKYQSMVKVCRDLGVTTPEDEFARIQIGDQNYVVALLFMLYDYSFKPDDVPIENAVSWAMEAGLYCQDESLLHPDPYPSRPAWCAERCRLSYERLKEIPADLPIILVNHFPLRGDLVTVPRIPRFRIWCGTKKTEDWHQQFNVSVVIYGHLHFRTTEWRDGVRFEEVSLGYPKQWRTSLGVEHYIRRILPQ